MPRRVVLDAAQLARAEELIALGWGRKRIGEALGVSPSVIEKRFPGHMGSAVGSRPPLPPLTPEQEAQARARRAEGWSLDRIASRLDCSMQVLKPLFAGARLPRGAKAGGTNHSRAVRSGREAKRLREAPPEGDAR